MIWWMLAGLAVLVVIVLGVRYRPRPGGRRYRSVSLALALVFGQVFDPPSRHVIEAKEKKQDSLPRPGDPPATP
jgi:hypothetical protein